MVKNLPTVERSTKVRFGKNTTNDQAENTLVFNASNTEIDADFPNSIYMTPLRVRTDLTDRNIVVMAYNRITKEVMDSGAIAEDILNFTLQAAVINGNVTANTVSFNNAITSVTTLSNVGIANGSPTDTLSVGSKLFVDKDGSNVLTVLGNTYIQNRLVVDGDATFNGLVTTLHSNNTVIKDAIIEIGKGNTPTDSTLDLGFILNRPGSNVVVGFLEGTEEIALGYTQSSAEVQTITPRTDENINVHVYGQLFTQSNVGIINTVPIHTLDVGSNLFVDEFGSNVLDVTGNTSISADLTVDGDTLYVDSTDDKVGINTLEPDAELHVVGNAYVTSNLTVDTDTLHFDVVTNRVGINQLYPTKDLDVNGTIAATRRVDNSGFNRLLIGEDTGSTIHTTSNSHLISMGYRAGYDRQQSNSIAIGYQSGSVIQAESAVAVGKRSGETNQGVSAIAIGSNAGYENQGTLAVAIGENAGGQAQGTNTVAIGKDSASTQQGNSSIAIGKEAGFSQQGEKAIAIGEGAGKFLQGAGAIAIGYYAGYPTSQAAGSVIINGGTDTAGFNNTTTQDALFINPVRNVNNSNLMMYNADSKEITYGTTITNELNVADNFTVDTDTLFVDSVKDSIGINTATPEANLHVEGNAYISSNLTVEDNTLHVDTNKHFVGIETNHPDATLHVVGNAYILNNVTVDTNTLHVDTVNKSIGLGTLTPDANLHVVGNTYVSSNLTVDTDTLHVDALTHSVGIETKNPDANLHVVGNTYVSSNLTVDTDTLHVDATTHSLGIETKTPDANLHVVGNTYVSANLTVDTDTFHVDALKHSVGIETLAPSANLHVVGNTYVSSNLTVDTDTLHVDSMVHGVGIETKFPDANLHVVGNTYVSSNLTVDTDTFHVDATKHSVGIETLTPDANLHVVGNVYVSDDLTVDTDTFHVDAEYNSVGVGTVSPSANLHVEGNAYVSSTVDIDGTLRLNNATTALTTDLTSNVDIKVEQLYNVNLDAPVADQLLVYDGTDWVNEYPIHTYIKIRNDLPSTNINTGDAVYVRGKHNANILNVGLAQSNSPSTMPCIGLSNQTLTPGQQGTAVAYGKALSVVTDTFLAGETVYVSNTVPGGLSNVKPYNNDLIQNVGVVTKIHESNGGVFVTGIGRANDIPNAPIVADETDINYVYVNNENNDLKKILPTNLLTQLQTFEQVSAAGNTVSNIMTFTNATTGIITTGNVEVGSNISVTGLVDPINKHLPMVGLDGFLEKSPVYVTAGGKYVISAAEAEFLGNITLSGNNTVVSSTSVTIEDRIFGIGANNEVHNLDTGLMMEHKDDGEYANIALIYHADEHRFSISYTQNTFTDDHILHFEDADHRMLIDLRGNVEIQNNLVINETLNVMSTSTFADDLTVGAVSNLFVDVSSSRVGINEDSPTVSLDVGGDARVQDTTDAVSTTTGALVVSGGIGVASNIHSTNVYAGSHVGVGTNAATAPLHILVSGTGETTNGIYMKSAAGSATNDAIVNLEVASDGGDAFVTWNQAGGEAFAMGLDRSENDLVIANSSSDLTTNTRLRMATDGAVTLTNGTNSTSKTTGALIVGGGLGVTNDIYGAAATFDSLTVDTDTLVVDATNKRVGIETSSPEANLHVVGNVIVSSNLTVDTNTLHVDAEGNKVGILTVDPAFALDVHGTSNVGALTATSLTVDTDTLHVDATNKRDGVETSSPEAKLHVVGNVYVSANLEVGASALYVDTVSATSNVGVGTSAPEYSLDVVGDINFSGDLYQGKELFVSTPWTIEESPDALSYEKGNVGIGDANPAANLHVTGNVYVSSNLNVDANVFIAGGLVTNTSGVTKKTYSYAGTFPAGTTDAQATLDIVFAAEVFSAKITAHLVEDDTEISVLSLDVGGGHKSGGTSPIIFKGPLTIFGGTNDNPWSSTVTTSTTTTDVTVSIKPTQAIQALITADYNIFVEYVSAASGGQLKQINDHQASPVTVTFGY